MKKMLLLIVLFLVNKLNAQTGCFIDSDLQAYSRTVMESTMKEWDEDINEAGVCVVKSSGEVLADVGIGYHKGKFKTIPGLNRESIPCGITRLVLFDAMLDVLSPDFEVEYGDGRLPLKRCVESDSTTIKALEISFKEDMGRFGSAVRKTGIFFENVSEDYNVESDKDQLWNPCAILYHNPFSLYQQVAWINGRVANHGKILLRFDTSSPVEPICVIKKHGENELWDAMLLSVKEGTGRVLDSPYAAVGGHLNVSPRDGLNCRALTAFACFGIKGEAPAFTIGVYINKHAQPAEGCLPASIVKDIINFMAKHGYLTRTNDNVSETATIETKKYHPAER